ncbi:MAG TPA: glycine oxidase ThiO [Candidatus Acidoferrales bacterium]|nr:glycine oxidase ThiO [Candidatus Acidoferrales bacterium]
MKSYDVIVAGAGIIGSSVARELARRGLHVLVLDRQEPGKEASWAAAGMLTPAAESVEALPLVEFAKASFALYNEFVQQVEQSTGRAIDYRREGALEVFFGDGAEDRRAAWLATFRGSGFEPKPLSAADLRRMEPALAADAAAGALLADEGAVDNRQLSEAVAEAARREGAKLRGGVEVTGIVSADGRATGVETRQERIAAEHVVMAAGSFTAQIRGAERYAPTVPARGQMVALSPASQGFGLPVRRVVRGPAYLVPRADGRLLVGATVEHVGYEKAVTPGGIGRLLTDAVRMVPALASAPIVETWSGLRPDTPDHLPILGPTDVEGLWFATGHFRNGILLAPGTARALGEWITEGKTSLPVERFSAMRFAHRAQSLAR